MNDRKFTFIDLFAGAGGLSEGFVSSEGFVPIAHVEMNEYASMTLKTRACYYYLKEKEKIHIYKRYQRGEILRDELYDMVPRNILDTILNTEISSDSIEDICSSVDSLINNANIRDIDIIIGGPPCQAYSLVGRAVDRNGMRDDPRNLLYKQYILFLKRYKPKMFIFENVPGILTANGGQTFTNILKEFNEAGYAADYKIQDSADFGVLQRRKRVIIIGWQKQLDVQYPTFQVGIPNATVKDLFSDLTKLDRDTENNTYIAEANQYLLNSGIRSSDDILTHHTCRFHNNRDVEIYKLVIEAWNSSQRRLKYIDLPNELCTHKNRNSFLDRFKVVAENLPVCHTMIAHIAKDGHYFIHPDINQCRSISVREAARIQSFPDNYYFEGPRAAKFVQIGNAVPPLMAKGLARGIRTILENI